MVSKVKNQTKAAHKDSDNQTTELSPPIINETKEFIVHYATSGNDESKATLKNKDNPISKAPPPTMKSTQEFLVFNKNSDDDDTVVHDREDVATLKYEYITEEEEIEDTKLENFNYRYHNEDEVQVDLEASTDTELTTDSDPDVVTEIESSDESARSSQSSSSDTSPRSSHRSTKLKIETMKDLERFSSAVDFYHEDQLQGTSLENMTRLRKLDLSGINKKLTDDDREMFIHIIANIAQNAPHIKKIYLNDNSFNQDELKALFKIFIDAKQNPHSRLAKVDLAGCINEKDLNAVLKELSALKEAVRDVHLDRDTRHMVRELRTLNDYAEACNNYLKHLEKSVIIPIVNESKFREEYANKSTLVRNIMRDAEQKAIYLQDLLVNPTLKAAMKMHTEIKKLETILKDGSVKPNKKIEAFDALYKQIKSKLPQLIRRDNDKKEYIKFLEKIGDKKKADDVQHVGYAVKTNKPGDKNAFARDSHWSQRKAYQTPQADAAHHFKGNRNK